MMCLNSVNSFIFCKGSPTFQMLYFLDCDIYAHIGHHIAMTQSVIQHVNCIMKYKHYMDIHI